MDRLIIINTKIKKYYLHVILIICAILVIAPFLWMLSTSFKVPGTETNYPPKWIPNPIDFSNYPEALNLVPLLKQMLNSLKVASIITVGQLITASMAAYAFARLKFPGRDILFIVYLATLMVPEHVTLVPQYVMLNYLGWLDTHNALIVPKLVEAFGTFLLRQFFLTIPRDLEESATIDGCSPFRIYWNIILPLSKPALTALGIFVFMGSWNNLLHPLVFISSMEVRTLPIGLAFFQDFYEVQYTLLMAGVAMALAPVIILYLFAQKYFIEGITLTGIKG